MGTMIKYEIRKMITKKISLAALALLLIWSIVSAAASLNGMYAYDGVSEEGRGLEAVKIEKEISSKYEGLLTDKKVQQIINDFPVRNFPEGLDAKYAYSNSIQSAVYSNFVDKDGNYNGKTVKEIYGSNRIKIGYINGWNYTVRGMIQVFFALMIVIMLIISPVFSGDYGSMSSIVISSRYGKSKNASARIIAAFVISFALALVTAVFNIAAALVIYGTEGLDCSVLFSSADFEGGLVPYNITCMQMILYQLAMVLAGTVAVTGITVAASAVFRNQISALASSLFVFVLPMLIPIEEMSGLYRAIVTMPVFDVLFLAPMSLEQPNLVPAAVVAVVIAALGIVTGKKVFGDYQLK